MYLWIISVINYGISILHIQMLKKNQIKFIYINVTYMWKMYTVYYEMFKKQIIEHKMISSEE